MKVGTYNIKDYLERLNEAAEESGSVKDPTQGLIIPPENKKAYDWLKAEYNKAKVEVKIEMKVGTSKFEPGIAVEGAKDFKPGMFGNSKTPSATGEDGEKKGEEKEKTIVAGNLNSFAKKNNPDEKDKDEDDKEEGDEKDKDDKEDKDDVKPSKTDKTPPFKKADDKPAEKKPVTKGQIKVDIKNKIK